MERSAPVEFDAVEFFKRPSVLTRLICILFSIVVFGCISAGSYGALGNCLFNGVIGACHFGVGIGVLAFLGCIVFIAIESQLDTVTNPDARKYIVMADMSFSALWTFLWFVCFCYLADMWRRTDSATFYITTHQINNCRAAIAFSFFSVITWAALTIIIFMKFRRGLSSQFDYTKDAVPGDTYSSPYASFPTGGESDPYQSEPFSQPSEPEGNQATGGGSDYKPPAY